MNWVLDILITHKRLRGLTESQLWELIEKSDDIESLRTIKEHLERNSFKYAHIQNVAPKMIERCNERAKGLLWMQQLDTVRDLFMEKVGDPFGR